MQVIAFATPRSRAWHWRIVDYGGAMVEESYGEFATIGEAVAAGGERLRELDARDLSARTAPLPPAPWRRG